MPSQSFARTPSMDDPPKPRWSADSRIEDPPGSSHRPAPLDTSHRSFLDDSLERLLSPLRTSNHTPKRRVRSASSTPLRQRPSSATSTPVRGRTALPQRTWASYLSRSPTKGRVHTPSKPITTPVSQFRSRTKSPSKEVSRRAPSPAKTRARARSASPFRHVEKVTPIVRAIDRPKYAQHSDRKIVVAEKQRQSASRQQDAFGGDAAKREWARWQRDHPVLRNVPMPQWRPSEEDLQRKDWSRMQHVMRHRIIDLEGSVLRWSNKAPPLPTVAPTRVPTVHSLPLEQGCCLALGLRYAGWRPFPYSSACPSATMIIVLVQYGRGVSR